MDKPLAATTLLLALVVGAPAAAASRPDWVERAGQSARHPRASHLVGYAVADGANAVERAKLAAAADLARSITVRIQSETLDQVTESGGRERYSASSMTRATTDVQLEGLGYELHREGAVAHALAFVSRERAAAGLRAKRDGALERARRLEADAGAAGEKGAGERLERARAAAAEALQAAAILRAVAEADARNRDAERAAGALLDGLHDRLRALAEAPARSLEDALARAARQLAGQGVVAPASLVVEPLTYGTTGFSSAFGRHFSAGLERALVAAGAAAGGRQGAVVVRGSYGLRGEALVVGVVARDPRTGAPSASAEVTLEKAAVPAEWSLTPQNLEQALVDQRLLAAGEEVSGGLRLELWTHKGDRSLVFSGGEEVRLYLRVNRPAYVRLIYLLANGLRVPLEQAYFIDASKVNHAVEYPEAFEVSPPFGVERIIAVAFTEKPAPLPTRAHQVDGERYEVVADDLDQVMTRARGLKKKASGPQVAEAALTLTTTPR